MDKTKGSNTNSDKADVDKSLLQAKTDQFSKSYDGS